MQQRLAGIFSRRQKNNDDGFSLIELVIAMAIIGGVLLALITLQTKAMVTIAQSKERKQATAIANEVLEQIRALPWKTITGGPADGAYLGSPYVNGDELTIPGEPITNEPLVYRTSAIESDDPVIGSPLDGIEGSTRTVHTDPALPGFEFDAYSYITQPGGANAPYNITVLVQWLPRGESELREVVARTSAFNTKSGCGSSDTRPYASACQDFFVAEASVSGPTITISGEEIGGEDGAPSPGPHEILPGSDIAQVNVSSASLGVVIDSAQSNKIRSNATAGSIKLVDMAGEETAVDSETVTAISSDSVTSNDPENQVDGLSASLPKQTIAGADMSLEIVTGSRSGSVAANSTDGCGSWAASGQPCGTASLSSGSQSVILKADGESIVLAEFSTTALGTEVGRFPGGSGTPGAATYCNVLAGAGCIGANASLGSYTANFKEIGRISSLAPKSGVGRGVSQNDTQPDVARAGSINLEGVSGTTLTPSESADYAPANPIEFSVGTVDIVATPRFSVDPLSMRTEFEDPECRSAACVGRGSVSPVLVSITYDVSTSSGTASFTLSTSLGETRATATYKAAPEAWEDEA